ncbi:Phosphoglycerate mutase [Pseudopedobacter saltans DSM 12145]|uniref:Phosphoglycerate mutase n=1 Tax=Pseudopedobacter saltans (strain ATCC 51119 / DSM 12145 / JCM 21818 / CCUG 39354 / LMG 10337 / NBRC 100064 / NCIMB 13643) TaxID=762903 RepID=F0SCC4_PSESL|nr:histidine phosphatase family protein [Pseudopedobacter saltans]ADY51721.1 Phosphoglycerate mutase [Pseudopedobacter saltans DSM 12145]
MSTTDKKKIYIIRHGETDYNKAGLVQGRGIDADLNEKGRAQGRAFFEFYKSVPFDKVYTSKLKRTHQTVRDFLAIPLPWEQLPGLDEMDWGKHEGQSISTEIRNEFEKIVEAWNSGDYSVKPQGGESPLDVYARQEEAMNYIVSEEKENEKTILICMHGRAIRLLLCQLTGRPLKEMDHFPHQNTSLYILNYADGKYEIETFNSLEHLELIKD